VCNSCPSNAICPLGASNPLDANIATQLLVSTSQNFFDSLEAIAYPQTNSSYYFVFVAAGCMWAILLLMFLLGWGYTKDKKNYHKMQSLDVLQVAPYAVPGPILRDRTIAGGFTSLLVLLIVVAIFIDSVLVYAFNNKQVISSIEPGGLLTDVSSSYLSSQLDLTGFTGFCVDSSAENNCAAGISVTTTGLEKPGAYQCSQSQPDQCTVLWYCYTPNQISATAIISYNISSFVASSYAIRWNVSANSVFDNYLSYTTGYIFPSQGNIFRGGEPSLAQVSVIATNLTDETDPSKSRLGLTCDFLGRLQGSQVYANSFYSSPDGVLVDVGLYVSPFVYSKQVLQKQSPVVAVSSFVALVGGVLTVARLGLGKLLDMNVFLVKKKAERENSREMPMLNVS